LPHACPGYLSRRLFSRGFQGRIEAVPKGQSETAYSQGFNYIENMRYVVLPQTVKIILPPMVNQVVNLIKKHLLYAAGRRRGGSDFRDQRLCGGRQYGEIRIGGLCLQRYPFFRHLFSAFHPCGLLGTKVKAA
jgi:hypothetical protein